MIELLVAMSIISLIALVFFSTVNNSIKSNAKNEKDIKSLQLVQSEMERLINDIKQDKKLEVHDDISGIYESIEFKKDVDGIDKSNKTYKLKSNGDVYNLNLSMNRMSITIGNENIYKYNIDISSRLDNIVDGLSNRELSNKETKIKTSVISRLDNTEDEVIPEFNKEGTVFVKYQVDQLGFGDDINKIYDITNNQNVIKPGEINKFKIRYYEREGNKVGLEAWVNEKYYTPHISEWNDRFSNSKFYMVPAIKLHLNTWGASSSDVKTTLQNIKINGILQTDIMSNQTQDEHILYFNDISNEIILEFDLDLRDINKNKRPHFNIVFGKIKG